MKALWGHDQAVAAWVGRHIPGGDRGFSKARGMAVLDEATVAGGVVFHDWNPEAGIMEISGAGVTKRWLSRNILWQLFSYPFNAVGCQMVIMRCSERNEHGGRGIRRILLAYGFKEHRIERLYGRDEAGLVFTLTDDDWRANRFHKEND